MYRNNLIVWLLTGCFIALVPSVGMAKTDVHTARTALQDATGKVGAPKVQGNDLYFGDTKASSDAVDAVVKSNGGVVAIIFVKSGDQFVRVATTVKKEDGSSAVGTALDANSRAANRTTGTRVSSARVTTLDMSRSRMHPEPLSELTS